MMRASVRGEQWGLRSAGPCIECRPASRCTASPGGPRAPVGSASAQALNHHPLVRPGRRDDMHVVVACSARGCSGLKQRKEKQSVSDSDGAPQPQHPSPRLQIGPAPCPAAGRAPRALRRRALSGSARRRCLQPAWEGAAQAWPQVRARHTRRMQPGCPTAPLRDAGAPGSNLRGVAIQPLQGHACAVRHVRAEPRALCAPPPPPPRLLPL